MRIDVFTLFPAMFYGPLQDSILRRAQQRSLLRIHLHNIRDYAMDRHQMTDDVPYGGGDGMVLKAEPVYNAVESVLGDAESRTTPVILMSPQGQQFNQVVAQDLAAYPALSFICGHYEGLDERIRQNVVTHELSIGDYVLTGGELAAMVIMDAVSRFIPGVLGAKGAAYDDSFSGSLLEGPQYTRPVEFRGCRVPDVLISGHHANIKRWQRETSLLRTQQRRPDLLEHANLDADDLDYLSNLGSE